MHIGQTGLLLHYLTKIVSCLKFLVQTKYKVKKAVCPYSKDKSIFMQLKNLLVYFIMLDKLRLMSMYLLQVEC